MGVACMRDWRRFNWIFDDRVTSNSLQTVPNTFCSLHNANYEY